MTVPGLARRFPSADRWTSLLLLVAGVLIAAGLGWVSGEQAELAILGALALVALAVASSDMLLPALLTVPCTLCVVRISGGESGLSVSDFVLFLGTISAVMMLRGVSSPELRSLLWVTIFYQAALVPTLIQNPYFANTAEWVHELFLVGGSLLVGYVVGRHGRASQACTTYLVLACGLALWACIDAPLTGFSPVYLPSFHKNVIGDMTAFAVIIAYARPPWLKWTQQWSGVALALCAAGMLASQSKQAIIGAAAGIVIVAVRRGQVGRRSKLVLMAFVPLLAFAYSVTSHQLSSNNQYNAVHQRFTFYSQSFDIWRHDRWLGVGLRWWYTFRFDVNFQPPNAELEMLTSAGIIGLSAFLISTFVAVRLVARLDPRYGTVAVALLIARFVQGQFDLFWVTAQSSLPWLIVGLTVGALVLAREQDGGQPGEQALEVGHDPLPYRGRLPDRVGDVALGAAAH